MPLQYRTSYSQDKEFGCSSNVGSGLIGEIKKDKATGGIYGDNLDSELLIFTNQNGDGQFGLPYLLAGRVDLPYPDTYGLTRKDDLAFVANGLGGIQVIDLSNLNAPYHVGFIKPNGFARDVKVVGNYAYIAASHQGLAIADISDPTMPVVAQLDTLGIANRIDIRGNKLYLTNMSGDGLISQLNVIDISDPQNPTMDRVVDLLPAREDFVQDGAYDVKIVGNNAYVSVHYSDQEDKPVQSLI